MSPEGHNGILPSVASVPSTSSSPTTPVIHDRQRLPDPEQGLALDRSSSQHDMARCETLNDPSTASLPPPFDEKSHSSLDSNTTHPQEDAPKAISRFTQIRSSKHFLSFTVALAVFVDLLCYGIIMPLTPFIVADLGLKSTANGALIACYAVGLLISSPVAGILSDKMANRRTPMIVGLLALLLSTVLFMEGLKHYWVLLVARFAAGLAGGTMMTLGFALLSDTYPSNQLGAEMGKIMIGQSLGLMAGPPLGGILQDKVGPKAPYVLCLVLIAIDLVARLLIIEPRSAKVKAIRKFQKQQQKEQKEQVQQPSVLTGGPDDPQLSGLVPAAAKLTTMRGLLKNKRLLTGLIVSFTQAFLIAALEPVMPLYLSDRFNLSSTQIGVIFLAISLPTFVSPVAGWFSDKHGAKIMCATAILFCVVFVVIFGIPGLPLWALILALVGIGATCAIYITPVLGEISAVVRVTGDGDGFARAFALFNMCFSLGMTAGPLLGSLIYQETSMLWTCILIAAVTVVIVPLVFLYMGGKEQKEKDQAQYEQDMQEQDLMLSRIQEEKRRKQELEQETPSSPSASILVDQKA
ncbi:hypothetical protein BGZ70_005795 [Mortierella alpina]|uniref:Major facilitator superfamily (MFS) profile domain-containing protein n=1 Tax=Mortierella alpina TaxID=64518 RepID=A0A9P6J8F9_MORAP|nr:hypothetical protein BGZ70_005795 [Mortierella alpina]